MPRKVSKAHRPRREEEVANPAPGPTSTPRTRDVLGAARNQLQHLIGLHEALRRERNDTRCVNTYLEREEPVWDDAVDEFMPHVERQIGFLTVRIGQATEVLEASRKE